MFSVILTCGNKGTYLKQCVEALLSQTAGTEQIEIHFVISSPSDEEREFLYSALTQVSGSIVLCDSKAQIHSAKNTALLRAKGELLVFLDDEVCPAVDLFEAHSFAHQKHGDIDVAIVGQVLLGRELSTRLFAHALQLCGQLHPLSNARENIPYGFDYFCSKNISVRRERLLRVGTRFSKEISSQWASDIDFGYEIWKRKFRIYYSAKPQVFCSAAPGLKTFLNESEERGKDLSKLLSRHRELMTYYVGVAEVKEEMIGIWAQMAAEDNKSLGTVIEQLGAFEYSQTNGMEQARAVELVQQVGEALALLAYHKRREALITGFSRI